MHIRRVCGGKSLPRVTKQGRQAPSAKSAVHVGLHGSQAASTTTQRDGPRLPLRPQRRGVAPARTPRKRRRIVGKRGLHLFEVTPCATGLCIPCAYQGTLTLTTTRAPRRLLIRLRRRPAHAAWANLQVFTTSSPKDVFATSLTPTSPPANGSTTEPLTG